jgi:hypothetical protein
MGFAFGVDVHHGVIGPNLPRDMGSVERAVMQDWAPESLHHATISSSRSGPSASVPGGKGVNPCSLTSSFEESGDDPEPEADALA